jgi:hypothetical protein
MYTDAERRETLANARATLARTAEPVRKTPLVYKTRHTPTPVADAVHETLA